MRKFLFILLLPVFLLLTSSVAKAQYENPLGNKVGGDVITIEEDEVVDRDFFAGGETVEIFGTVNGDVYVAGGMVTINGIINGDLLVAGGDLNIAGTVTDDVRAAGGNITVSADVGKNLTIFGGNIDITDSANIAGSVVGGGGNFIISGPIGKDISVGAGTMTLSNSVGGDVETGVGELRLTSQANLSGDLYYYSDTDASISDAAVVSGIVERNDPAARFAAEVDEKKIREDAEGFLQGVTTTARMISFTSLLVIGLIIMKLFPNYSERVTTTLKESTWKSLGFGALALFLTPIAVIFIMITLVGIPIGLITLVLYLVALYVSKVFVMFWAGQFLMKRINRKSSIYATFTLGLIAYSVVALIPVIGGFMKFFVLIFSLGAMLLTCKESYMKARESKIY